MQHISALQMNLDLATMRATYILFYTDLAGLWLCCKLVSALLFLLYYIFIHPMYIHTTYAWLYIFWIIFLGSLEIGPHTRVTLFRKGNKIKKTKTGSIWIRCCKKDEI